MATILVADDESNIRDVVQYALERDGHRVHAARDGAEAIAKTAEVKPDLIVLDVVMPELDGLEVCRRVRATSAVPILFLSSRAEETDRIVGLELGGDDYLVKPFGPRELATRVKAILRRVKPAELPADGPGPEKALRHGAIELNLPRHELRVRGERVDVTVTEFGVLQALLERPGHVLSRAQLMDRIYLHDNHVSERTIDSHVKRVRARLRALGVDPIETVHGLGYRAAPA